MSDLISREEAIDAVNGLEYIQDYVKDYVNSVIGQVPSTDQWIPCSERLPEINDVVVMATVESNLDIGKRWVRILCYDIHGIWCYPSGEPYDQTVLAWMPLPEPYTKMV